jgi:hypothetical protein
MKSFGEIEAQAEPLMAELWDTSARFEERITGTAFALAFLKCLAVATVLKGRDTDVGVEFLHDLLDVQILAARKDKAEDKLKPPHMN